MFITAIEVLGPRDLPRFSATGLDRVVRIKGPSPAATALGDSLELFFGALSASRLQRFLHRVELLQPGEEPEIIAEPHPVQASWRDRKAALVQVVQGERSRTISVELRLDPPLYRTLSDQAAREPRMVSALGAGAGVRMTVGALLATSMDALSLTLTHFEVGGERFPTAENERPPWMRHFLRTLVDRYNRAEGPDESTLPARVMDVALSRDRYPAFVGWQRALLADYGQVRPALGPGGRPFLLADDLPLRRYGPGALARAALAADAWLHPCDLLWVDEAPTWIEGTVEGEDSPLEQVFRICPEGELDPTPVNDGPLPLRHPGRAT